MPRILSLPFLDRLPKWRSQRPGRPRFGLRQRERFSGVKCGLARRPRSCVACVGPPGLFRKYGAPQPGPSDPGRGCTGPPGRKPKRPNYLRAIPRDINVVVLALRAENPMASGPGRAPTRNAANPEARRADIASAGVGPGLKLGLVRAGLKGRYSLCRGRPRFEVGFGPGRPEGPI
jgi:hypothetical protein